MYQALYRKWRPATFEDVAGQQHITSVLRHEVDSGRLAHAYLFTGTRGTGKTTCAKILAKAANCLSEGNRPCLTCENCRGIDDGSLVDVSEIDAASNNSVEDVRRLREEAYFLPVSARYRVYIIDEVHMLSQSAFNALLKIMEEPPEHVIFILATTEAHKVPATVASRCQRFEFKRIGTEEIVQRITQIAQAEGGSIDPEAARLIASVADGGLRDAVSILDRCLSQDSHITRETVALGTGLSDRSYLFALGEAIARQDVQGALTVCDSLYQDCADFSLICSQLMWYYRNLLVFKASGNGAALVLDDPDDLQHIQEIAPLYKMEDCFRCIRTFSECMEQLARSAFPRIEFEMALIRAAVPEKGGIFIQAGAQPSRAEKKPKAVVKSPASFTSEDMPPWEVSSQSQMPVDLEKDSVRMSLPDLPVSPGTDEAAQQPEKQKEGQDQQLACWPDILALIAKRNPALYGTLRGSNGYLSGRFVLIDSKDELFLKLMRENEFTKSCLKTAIAEVTGKRYGIGPYRKTEAVTQKVTIEDVLNRARECEIPVVEE